MLAHRRRASLLPELTVESANAHVGLFRQDADIEFARDVRIDPAQKRLQGAVISARKCVINELGLSSRAFERHHQKLRCLSSDSRAEILSDDMQAQVRWPKKRILIGLIAASVPFGSFWFDRSYLRREP